jgi:hypothetical protein
MKSGIYRFVLQFCPACEHSHAEFKKFEKMGRPKLTANSVIKEIDSGDPLTKRLNITAFPTYLIVTKSGKIIEQQDRDAESLFKQARKYNICGSKTKLKKKTNKLSRRK